MNLNLQSGENGDSFYESRENQLSYRYYIIVFVYYLCDDSSVGNEKIQRNLTVGPHSIYLDLQELAVDRIMGRVFFLGGLEDYWIILFT